MALNGTVLKDLIKTNLVALGRPAGTLDEPGLLAIANAIVQHITTSGVVNVTNVSAVEPGAGTSGPGSGTIT